MGDRLHQQQRRFDLRKALAHNLDHVVAETGARLVQARRVEQDILRIAAVHDAVDAVARGLRLAGDDGDLLAHQRVCQTGLADVRPAADGDHSGFFDVHR